MKINEATRKYIREHSEGDVRTLALQGVRDPDVDLTMALQQIAGRQTARRKLPTWAAVEGIVYPPHLNMEQCSSEQTARYKAGLLDGGNRYVDLTGGLGVDFYWMSQGYRERCYVERDEALCAIAEGNFRELDLQCSVCCSDSTTYLSAMAPADVIYLDPARRNEHGSRTYGIADCTPNVLELLPLLLVKAHTVVLKLSPMLDWRKAVGDLEGAGACVGEVHIVSVDNECKELLLLLGYEPVDALRLCCVNNSQVFSAIRSLQNPSTFPTDSEYVPYGLPVRSLRTGDGIPERFYLYEPNASIMKAGCFAEVEECFAVRQVAPNSHLFLSPDEIGDFPGRRFQISAMSSVNRKQLTECLKETGLPLERANISVRNFPLTAEQLRRKLKMKDGGDTYIFATTFHDGERRLLICRKIS